MKRIAIIPARGGSKRFPRKNIAEVRGHPAIAYPIRAAIHSNLFNDIIVTTDDLEIQKIAMQYGARTLLRPTHLATDQSTVAQVCADILIQPEFNSVDLFCCIYATALFITSESLAQSLALFDDGDVECVMGVSEYNYHPVQALKLEGKYLRSMWPDLQSLQSQKYPRLCVSNGTLYWLNKDAFMNARSFYLEKMVGYFLESVDIDTQEEYFLAKKIADQCNLSLE